MPGAWATERSRRETRRVWLLLALFGVSILTGALAARLGWLSSGHGAVAGLGVVALALIAFRSAEQASVEAIGWVRGSRAEREVGIELERLRGEGMLVLHDLELDHGGNVDHLVCGRTGAYVVETKLRRYEERHLRQAKREASWAHERLRVWVTPVICLATRDDSPYRRQGVWVMGRAHLVDWLRAGRGTPVDPQRARQALDD